MVSTVQPTHICSSNGCSWRDVNFVYRNAVFKYYSQPSPSQPSPFVKIKHRIADDVTAGYQAAYDNRSVVAASAGSRTRVQQALDASISLGLGVALELP